ncbi:MAG: ROK family protein [Verrucomicrobiales bacterium]
MTELPGSQLIASVEAGGTKFVCAIGRGPGDVVAELRIPTTTPEETIGRCLEFFSRQKTEHGAVAALGVATFGPAGLNPARADYGYITTTPKPGWQNVPLLGALQSGLGGIPARFDTDVNAAALAEWKWGAGKGVDSLLYYTIGTGIGGGFVSSRGAPLHGLVHPEMGHVRLPRDPARDPFTGACPFHGDCFEGLASGTAIEARWNQSATHIPPEHPAWDLEAEYIALALNNSVCSLSPERLVLGGGVMEQQHLFPLIRLKLAQYLNGYIDSTMILEQIDQYVVPPALANQAGLLGGIALGQAAISTLASA